MTLSSFRPLVSAFAFSLFATMVTSRALGAEHSVSQKDKIFAPETLNVKVGDTVTFVNDDTVAHNVFSKAEGHAFNLKIQKPGERSSTKMEKEGSFEARCAIHPKMVVKITVTK